LFTSLLHNKSTIGRHRAEKNTLFVVFICRFFG
jgi:hypothetical protein